MNTYGYQVWVADFETSTEPWALLKGYTEVWAYAITNAHVNRNKPLDMTTAEVITNYRKPGDSFDNFLDDILRVTHDGDKVYFHNLKFDGKFLLSGLLERGFSDVTCAANVSIERKKMYDRSFSVLVAGTSWYSVTVEFGGKKIEFRDSLKRIPMTVSRMAKEYHLPILKGDIDYDRDPSLPVTREELEYIRHDVLIVAEVLRQQYREGFTQLTTAAFAFSSYKQWLKGRGFRFKELFPELPDDIDTFVRRAYEGGEVYSNPKFQDQLIGDPYSDKIIGHTWDINSMYPAVMSTTPIPYGMGHWTTAEQLGFTRVKQWRQWRSNVCRYFIEIRAVKATLRPGRLPSVGVVTGFGLRDYPEKIERYNIVMADVRFEQLLIDYHIQDINLGAVLWFPARTDLFFDYLQGIVTEKNEAGVSGNLMRKSLAKVKMNSLYGKFGQKPVSISRYFTWGDDGLVENLYESFTGGKYIPVAAIVTAESRRILITQANKFGSNAVAYMDTDSIHVIDAFHNVKVSRRRPLPRSKQEKTDQMTSVLTQEELIDRLEQYMCAEPSAVWCDEFDLGAFKIESEFSCAKWLRAKTYFEGVPATSDQIDEWLNAIADGERVSDDYLIPERAVEPRYHLIGCIKGAGIPEKSKMEITVENFKIGLRLTGKLVPRPVKGGVVLHESEYEIKANITRQIELEESDNNDR